MPIARRSSHSWADGQTEEEGRKRLLHGEDLPLGGSWKDRKGRAARERKHLRRSFSSIGRVEHACKKGGVIAGILDIYFRIIPLFVHKIRS